MRNIQLMCGDGFAGRSYYILINGVRIDVCLNQGDVEEATEKALDIFKKLEIDPPDVIHFKHDGWM